MKTILLTLLAVAYSCLMFAQPFVTTWQTTTNNESIVIPTTGTGYNYSVDWGDGNVQSGITGNATHTYTNPGTYTVSISGDFPHIYFSGGSEAAKLKSIEQWGAIEWTSMTNAFYGCSNLVYNATDTPDLSKVKSLGNMFRGCTSFNGDLSDWDVSNVTFMGSVFEGATSFNGDISTWDVSSVTYMSSMFAEATSFNQDISGWNTVNVVTMQYMFYKASVFNQDISKWNMSKVMNTQAMFYEATAFDQDISGWDMNSDTTMAQMFVRASSFNKDIGGWKVSAVRNMRYMFYEATSFNQTLNNWDVSSVTDLSYMFYGASSFNEDISAWNTSKVTNMEGMFYKATSFNMDISNWDVSSVNNMSHMFNEATSFNQKINGWNTGSVTTMYGMFLKAYAFNQNLNDWVVSSVTDMGFMFSNATTFNGDITKWDVSSVNNMQGMFINAWEFDQDISKWNVSSVTNMSLMFTSCQSFDQDLGGWNVSNVSNFSNMLIASGLTVESFDKLLIGWAALPSVQTGMTLGASGLFYCNGEAARNTLVTNKGWTISASKNCGNIAPTKIKLSSASINEHNNINDVIGSLTTLDKNQVDTHTYSLVSGAGDTDNASFIVSGDQLLAAVVFDYEIKSSYSIRVQTDDGKGGVFAQELTIAINNIKEDQTITFSVLSNRTYGDAPFELTATSTSGLQVTYSSSNEAVATINGTTITIVGAGSTIITATQSGNEEFNAAVSVNQTLIVNKADQTITIEPIADKAANAAAFEVIASTTSGLELTYGITGPASISGSTITLNGTKGTVTVTVSQAGNQNYNEATESISFEVTDPVSGINDPLVHEVKVYPNPIQNYLIVQHQENVGSIQMYDLMGTLIYTQQSSGRESRLELSDLPAGIYCISLGNNRERYRVIKK